MSFSQVQRFQTAADTQAAAIWPATISIGGTQYACVGVGGDAGMEFAKDGGQVKTGVRYFRISKAVLATRPEEGTFVTVVSGSNTETALQVIESPDRPHETSWVIRCAPRNR